MVAAIEPADDERLDGDAREGGGGQRERDRKPERAGRGGGLQTSQVYGSEAESLNAEQQTPR